MALPGKITKFLLSSDPNIKEQLRSCSILFLTSNTVY